MSNKYIESILNNLNLERDHIIEDIRRSEDRLREQKHNLLLINDLLIKLKNIGN